MVLGSHQFSRHANQHTHGSRTHRLGRRHLACTTAPLWHRPIYRQWGIPPRPETAIASVARAGSRASMPRVICGGDQLPKQPRSPPIPKQRAFRAKRETAKGTRIPIDHILLRPPASRPQTQGIRGRDGDFSPEYSAGRKEAPQREARCGASLHVRGRSGEKSPSRSRIPGGSSRPCRP